MLRELQAIDQLLSSPEQLRRQQRGDCSSEHALPRHPSVSPAKRRQDEKLLAALLSGAVPVHEGRTAAMFKPTPWRYVPGISHIGNCTACANQEAWRRAVERAPLAERGQPNLLIDGAPLSDWAHVVLELERPTKRPVTFATAEESTTAPGRTIRKTNGNRFGMPGTVIHDQGRFRAWFDQTEQTYFESIDGLHFVNRPDLDRTGWGLPLIWTRKSQRVRRNTWTVTMDPLATPEERYKAAFACGEVINDASLSGHTPAQLPPSLRRPPWELSVDVPRYQSNDKMQWWWESTCLAYSADGLQWTEYNIGIEDAKGLNRLGRTLPEPLRMAGDTANVIFQDEAAGVHRAVNRWNAAVPEGLYGTTKPNRNWWREARGVRVSSNPHFAATGRPRAWTEDVRWLFDREGPTEHLRRQIYSLQVTPFAGMFIGVLNVIEWGKLLIEGKAPPFERDVMRIYLATSRDGVHFDSDWAYAGQELIPHGQCREPPGCATNAELLEALPKVFELGGPTLWRELCCPFDHGILIPASQLVTFGGEHLLHYEGRQARHEERYDNNRPHAIAAAAWQEHRLAGVRRDPSYDGVCGFVVSKPIRLASRRRARQWVTVNLHAPPGDNASALLYELVPSCADARTASLKKYSARRSLPIRGNHSSAMLRWTHGSDVAAARVRNGTNPKEARLRFWLCGDVKLFAFTVWRTPHNVTETTTGTGRESAAPSTACATDPGTRRDDAPEQLSSFQTFRGLCSLTNADSGYSCARSSFTSGSLNTLRNQMHNLSDCIRACLDCPRCRYVSASFSAPAWDCSWYSSCDVERLMLPIEELRSMRDKTEARKHAPLHLEPNFVFDYVTVDVHSIYATPSSSSLVGKPGYCRRVAHDQHGNCASPTGEGSYDAVYTGIRDLTSCARLCAGCKTCRYVSFSRARSECNWYASCDLSKLSGSSAEGSEFRTAHVDNALKQRLLPSLGCNVSAPRQHSVADKVTYGAAEAVALLSTWRRPDCLLPRFRSLGGSPATTQAFLLYDAPRDSLRDLPMNVHPLPQPKWRSPKRALFSLTAGSTKGSFVEWLAASNFTRAWYLEDDAVFTGEWSALFEQYQDSTADLVAYVDTNNLDSFWYSNDCSICDPPPGLVHWPVLRMSRRLALHTIALAERGERGHGEVFLSGACHRASWCKLEQLSWERLMIPTRQTRKECCTMPRRPAANALYHPIKCEGSENMARIDEWRWRGRPVPRIANGSAVSVDGQAGSLHRRSRSSKRRRGYCAVTTGGLGDCNAGSSGSFALTTAEFEYDVESVCVQRCRQCKRCRYVSFSKQWKDCSWFHQCPIRELETRTKGFWTVPVSSSVVG